MVTRVSDKGAGERPHGLVRRCGKAVRESFCSLPSGLSNLCHRIEGEVPINPILDKGTRAPSRHSPLPPHHSCTPPLPQSWTSEKPCCDRIVGTLCGLSLRFSSVWISAFAGTTNRAGMTKETPFPWSPYPKLGLREVPLQLTFSW